MVQTLYNRLRGKRRIRILTLEAGTLSYEWKENLGFTSILCDGVDVSVTRNLSTALGALRLNDRPRFLWVDAICINQNDLEEKSKQIPLMRDIYASAKSVLLWLGSSFRGVETAFTVFSYLAQLALEKHPTGKPDTVTPEQFLANSIIMRPKHGSLIRQKELILATHDRNEMYIERFGLRPDLTHDERFRFGDDETWEAIDTLFGNSYFQRCWIVQEVAVAEVVYVICGPHKIHWDLSRLANEGRIYLILFC
ncbi:heterokaryon incompatibility protein-domain-containing protein [Xylogone sp. PMI_703]|nr:heterokaryon incompatibility protein-domain-containing protein [Xylogone sp. PMI_703]